MARGDVVYDSDDYDSDERAEHLALAFAMRKRSQAKVLLDASYNRFAWNDDAGT